MQDHDQRSMANNSLVIERRMNAMEFLRDSLTLPDAQKHLLVSKSYWFCAIHAYLDHDVKKSANFLSKIKKWGWAERKLWIKIQLAKIGIKP
jgi:hypothetical protein